MTCTIGENCQYANRQVDPQVPVSCGSSGESINCDTLTNRSVAHFSEFGFLLRLGELILLIGADADLAVHDAGVLKLAQQILQLQKVLAVLCDDLSETTGGP